MPSTPLSVRLRQLRNSWPGRTVKQSRVAEALGVTGPSISAYENGTSVPPPERLHDYAVLFASPRWLTPDAPRRVTPAYLDPDERKTFTTLNTELNELSQQKDASDSVADSPTPFWRFPHDEPVRIFCGRLHPDEAGPYGDVADHNYMRLRNAADLDALVELWGHIRRLNPESDVRFVLGDSFTSEDLTSHVVILGNIAQIQGAGRLMPTGTIPVQQTKGDHPDGEIFTAGSKTFEPVLDDDGRVVQDVGLIARVPNPHRGSRTLTVCSGVFTRGVYGAVRTLTERSLRDDNAAFLRERFGTLDGFTVLIRVRVAGDTVVTPDLRAADNWLYESSSRPAAHAQT